MSFRSANVTRVPGIVFVIVATIAPAASTQDRPVAPAVRTTTPSSSALPGRGLPEIRTTGAPGLRELTVLEDTVAVTGDSMLTTVLGEIRNDTDSTIGTAVIEVAAVDTAGNLLEVDRRSIPGTPPCEPVGNNTNLIRPGETSVFGSYLSCDSGDVASVLVRAIGFVSSWQPCDVPMDLVGDWVVTESSPGWSRLTGTIRNPNDTDIVDLGITVAARDAEGAVVALDRLYPWSEIIGGYAGGLRAGGELEVSLSLRAAPEDLDPLALETSITARPYDGGIFRYGVAGIAHSPGANASVWRSSLDVTNLSGAPARAILTYFHAGGRSDAVLEIGAGESVFHDDVARTLFGVSGRSAGYLQITSSAPLTLSGRTSNETNLGGFGQSLPVYTPEMTGGLWYGNLSGLRGGDGFRTNIGLVNMAGNDCSCDVRLYATDGTLLRDFPAVELDETDWLQLNDVVPGNVEFAYATVDPGQGCWIWAYASVIEEATGDPTTVEVDPATVVDLAPTNQGSPGWSMGGWPDQQLP